MNCWAVCELMPDRLWHVTAWLDLTAKLCEKSGLPLRYAPKFALILFTVWRERDPECSHWYEHCDEAQLLAAHELATEWLAFAENFPDMPRTPADVEDPFAAFERQLREAAA